jgi:Ger(x)C family germination protein
MRGRQVVLLISLILLFISYIYDTNMKPVENLEIISGAGYDILEKRDGKITYSIPLSTYVFESDGKITREMKTGIGTTIAQTRGDRQRKSDKKFLLGLEKVYVISEDYARLGIRSLLDILFSNPQVNDSGAVIICKGRAEDLLTYEIKGYSSSADYLEGMINSAQGFNFFPNSYTLMDVFIRVDSEGRRSIIPYIELKQNGPEVTGLALFSRDKMVDLIDMSQARILNLLRENKGSGSIQLQKDDKNYVDYYSTATRKVKVSREGERYSFDIDLLLEGGITSIEGFPSVIDDPYLKKQLEEDFAYNIKIKCDEFIIKMKSEYRLDLLDLGRLAAAKYGRHENKDWDKIVSSSDIKVNVKVKIEKEGKGNY